MKTLIQSLPTIIQANGLLVLCIAPDCHHRLYIRGTWYAHINDRTINGIVLSTYYVFVPYTGDSKYHMLSTFSTSNYIFDRQTSHGENGYSLICEGACSWSGYGVMGRIKFCSVSQW